MPRIGSSANRITPTRELPEARRPRGALLSDTDRHAGEGLAGARGEAVGGELNEVPLKPSG